MKKNTLIVLICVLFLQGCASYGTPEERMAKNKNLPDYTLCEKLFFATMAPEAIRAEWATELQNRDKDCNAYAATFAARSMQNSANTATLLNYSTQMLRAPQPMYAPQMPMRTNCRQIGGSYNCTSW